MRRFPGDIRSSVVALQLHHPSTVPLASISLANVTLLGEDRVQIRGGIHRGRCREVGGSGFERLDQLPLLVDFHSYKDHVVSIL